ncbi:MAG TPA: hypothetical protein VM433_11230 [Mycobacteriales bacterium]|nr:hypothetical protein [Mycobacteriales bacterium]
MADQGGDAARQWAADAPDPVALATGLPCEPEAAADRLLAAADAVGPAEDDCAVLLARPLPPA